MADIKIEKQKVKEITDKLEEGLKELFESEKYKSYLSTMSKFYNYSFNNTLLIAMQKPEATLIAGFKAWQTNFNRYVKKGEKGIRILAPAPYEMKEERDKLDPVTGEVIFDENGMPQTEEVKIKIPAFRVVSVFDVSQTDGEPIPELKTKELLSTVEGYEDFRKAVTYVAPVSIGFEDILGDSKGYFSIVENRIAVQEGMSESQTLKTMIHEIAHSMLHSKEINKEDILAQPKDRNTKEVEAESIAYTVCQHFGIETSEYSFGYIAGWSSGKDMKELKSSLDTIRKTASELIIGIEEQLQELQRDREIMQEQEKESTLLIRNSDLSEYNIVSVYGMDVAELVEALSVMNNDDRLNVAAYLESRSAWITEIVNQDIEEFEEYHLDVSYNINTNEVINLEAEMELDEKAKESIGEDDVILKITYADGFEIERITNKTPEEVQEIMDALIKLEENRRKSIHRCLENYGANYIPIIVSGGRNNGYPLFYDFEVDLNKKEISMKHYLSSKQQDEGIFGIEKNDWENERNYRTVQEKLAESGANKEMQLLYGSTDKYGIYQLKDSPELRDFHFMGTAELLKRNLLSDNFREIQPQNYNLVYTGELAEMDGQTQGEKLSAIYKKFNIDCPTDYKGHSLSVSDIIVLHKDGENSTHFLDSYGFTELIEFTMALEGVKEQDAKKEELKEEQEYKISYILNRECKEAIEKTIQQNFDGMYLKNDIVKPLVEQYGSERVAFILANTLQELSGDGRFSRDNKMWASEFFISEDVVHGINKNCELIVSSHPAVLDGFIGMFRKEVLEQEKEVSTEYEKIQDTFGHNVQKLEVEQIDMEQTEQLQKKQTELKQSELQLEQNELEKSVKMSELDDMKDEDEIIDLGDEREQVLLEMKKSLAGEQEKELAFQIADRYISIQKTESGYDYSIMGIDYKEIDGGVYDNLNVSIKEAINDIVADLKENPFDNGARGNICDNDKLIPIDYDGLMEKIEVANCIEPQGDVVAEFKAKTNKLFHKINEMNPSEIEETVKHHVQEKLEEYGVDAEIMDIAVTGSRCRGLESEGSDLDVVVELSTNEREYFLFDIFNENEFYIGGIKVDINPITVQRTGTLETYLPQAEEYLEGLRESRENELVSIFNIRMNDEERWFKNTSGLDTEGLCKAYAECDKPFVEMEKYGERINIGEFAQIEQGDKLDFSLEFNEETDQITIFDGENFEYKGLKEIIYPQKQTEVTLTVAECGEFHNLGKFYENISTVDEAVAIWKQIPPEHMNGIPAIGINIHKLGTEKIEDIEIDILSGKKIELDVLEYIPDIKNNLKVMEIITELVAKLPEMEIDGSMSEEMEAAVWEKRMSSLTPTEQLAVELDRFIFNYNATLYRESTQNMTENIFDLTESINQGDTSHLTTWIVDVIAEGTEPEETKKAVELLKKLTDYKPFAKTMKMKEQNYNIVDNVMNNGAGEKAQKEENKKEQKYPIARTSLKTRLAEKKALVSGQGNDHETQENNKKNHWEI